MCILRPRIKSGTFPCSSQRTHENPGDDGSALLGNRHQPFTQIVWHRCKSLTGNLRHCGGDLNMAGSEIHRRPIELLDLITPKATKEHHCV